MPKHSTAEEVSIDTNTLCTIIEPTKNLLHNQNDSSEPQEKEAFKSCPVDNSNKISPVLISFNQNDVEKVSTKDSTDVAITNELDASKESASATSQITSPEVEQQLECKATKGDVDKIEAFSNDAMDTRSNNPTINNVPNSSIDALTNENKCKVPAVQIPTNTVDTKKMVSTVGPIVEDSIDDTPNSISNQLANNIESKCDNVESDSDKLCLGDSANHKKMSSSEIISCQAKPEQLDSESDERKAVKNIDNGHVDENCTTDCDSSDTLETNKIGLIDGAKNVSSVCGSNDNRKHEDVIDIEAGTKFEKTVATNNYLQMKVDVEPSKETKIDALQVQLSKIETKKEKKDQALDDEPTLQKINKSTKDDENCSISEKMVDELNNGAKLNCVNLNACEKEPTPSDETKSVYNFNKNVFSTEIAPRGFKDKFKKSLEIMEKFKQETNQQRTVILDVNKSLKNPEHELNKMKEEISITVETSQSEQNIKKNTIGVCNLTEVAETPSEDGEISRTTNELTIFGERSISSNKKKEQNDRTLEDGTSDEEFNIKQTTTRTIIMSPQNEIQRKNYETESSISNISTSNSVNLFVDNPDFSASLRVAVCDLSGLKMKTPDFSQLGRATELQVPNPDFTKLYDKLQDNHRRSPTLREVNPSNFAEISKKYNFISDLQLKNPSSVPSNTNKSNSSTCRSLYVQPPNFNSTRLRNQIENDSDTTEEPTPHIIHKSMYRTQADSSSISCRSPSLNAVHGDQPLIPNDSVMQSQVQKTSKVQILQSKEMSYPTKPPTPLHTQQNVQSSDMHLSMLHQRQRFDATNSNSQNYHYSQNQARDKSLPHVHKPYTEPYYQRNAIISTHPYQSPIEHAFHHRDASMLTAQNTSKDTHSYEHYAQSSQNERTAMPIHVQLADHYSVHTGTPSNMLYTEQSRIKKNIHQMHDSSQPSSSSHINYQATKSTTSKKLTSTSTPIASTSATVWASTSIQNLNKPSEFYNQMNPPQKWSNQSRITQSPISTASSPQCIGSQNTQISQSPVSASPLTYPIHRQSPSYSSPHPTPSPSPFSYPHGTSSPVSMKPIKLPSNTQTSNNLSQNLYSSRHSSDNYGFPTANAMDKKYSQHSISPKLSNESRSQQKIEANRFIEIQHESRQHDHQSTSSHHRSLSLPSKSSIKTETTTIKYSDRLDYKRPNTIVDPLIYRQSSEADLNYQIIKKTLNKEIPTPSFNRKNADMNSALPMCSSRLNAHSNSMIITSQNINEIVGTADSKQHHLLHNNVAQNRKPTIVENKHENEMFNTDKLNTIRHSEANNIHYQGSHYPPNNQTKQAQHIENHTNYEQTSMQSLHIANSNHTANQYTAAMNHRNQLSVNPSIHQKLTIQESPNMIPNHPVYEQLIRPTTETRPIKQSTPSQPLASLTPANDVSSTKSASLSIFVPKKRESPLDLSVKTVKTKADSTGVYDYSMPMRRHDSIPASLKVDFAPNFMNSPTNNARNNNAPRFLNRTKVSTGVPNVNIPLDDHPHMVKLTHYNQPSLSQMEHSQRPLSTATSDNNAIELDSMYNETIVQTDSDSRSKQTIKTNSPSSETKMRKDSKMPMIFGQKPEDLKNFKPDELRVPQNETSNKPRDIMSSSIAEYHESKERDSYQGRSNHSYQSMPPSLQRHNENTSQNEHINDVIQIVPHSRVDAQHKTQNAALSNDQHKSIAYPHYKAHDAMHRNHTSYAFNQSQPNMDYGTSSSAIIEHFKANHQNRGGPDVQYSMSQKRPAENGLNEQSIPLKQLRYDHGDKTKHQHANANQYYGMPPIHSASIETPVDRVQIYASPFAEISNQKPIEKAISTPVIVQTKHAKPIDTNYQHNPNEKLDNKQNLQTPRQNEASYEQTKSTNHPYQSLPNYANDFKTKEIPIAAEDKLRPSAASQTNPVSYQPVSYQANTNYFGLSSTSTVTQSTQLSFKQHHNVLNKGGKDPYVFETSVIKSAEYPRSDSLPPIEPFRYVNSNNAPKPVDQRVISQLRNNLEQKEIEKQKQKQMKNQNSFEKFDEDSNKSEIASLIAARIRTKGELKGFIMDAEHLSKQNPAQSISSAAEKNGPFLKNDKVLSKGESKFVDNMSRFDLLDWGSTCNDFLEQLQNNEDKQRSKAQRRFNLNDSIRSKGKEIISNSIKLAVTIPTTNESNDRDVAEAKDLKKSNTSTVDESSSDEDKPLLLLRQQSLNESSKNLKINTANDNDDDSSTQCSKSTVRTEKQSINKHVESKKRLAMNSSSESEDNSDRTSKRSKKMKRKPRTRSSINNKSNDNDNDEESEGKSLEISESESGDDDDDDSTLAKKHCIRQSKFSSSSSSTLAGGLNNKTALSKHQEMKSISKQKLFSMDRIPNKMNNKRNRKLKSSSESEVDANRNSKKKKSLELNESDSGEDDDDSIMVKKRPHIMKVEETMTRSKRKRELEMEMANSKVLRNDKMIKCAIGVVDKKGSELKPEQKINEKFPKMTDSTKNTPTKSEDSKKKSNRSDCEIHKTEILRKSVRTNKQLSSSNESEESSSEAETITERLRSRKSKLLNAISDSDAHKDQKSDKVKPGCSNLSSEVNQTKSNKNTAKKMVIDPDMSEDSRSQFPPGWEEQAYEYKRKLKIPPRLITIGRPSWHRKSTSLPDLDPQHSSDASETFAEMSKKCAGNNAVIDRVSNKKPKSSEKKFGESSTLMANDSDNSANDAKSKSIIDLLHQRVSRPTGKNKKSRINHNSIETRILPQSNEVELLPTPGSEGTNVFKSENVFETAVLKSRTRKEYKAMKTQEIIREVFGGEDRPASAPPFNFDIIKQEPVGEQEQDQKQESLQQSIKELNSNTKLLTFDQQYEEYLQKMNVDYGEKIRKVKSAAGAKCNAAELGNLIPKIEKMDEDSLMDPDEESQDTEITECNRNSDGIKQEIQDEAMERGDTPSALSELDRATPTSFSTSMKTKKNRSNRHSRRKGSSGL